SRCPGIACAAHLLPPAPDALHRERAGVVVRADAHPGSVLLEVVHAIWADPSLLGIDEVMHSYLLGLALGLQFTSTVPVFADELFLLRIDRDHGLVQLKLELDSPIDVLELRVAIGMLAPLQRLLVGLEAIAHLMQQL